MNENDGAMSQGIEVFLQSIGLHCYHSIFIAKGYDRESDLQHLGEMDLDDLMITERSHRRLLLEKAKKHQLSEEGKLLEWLREHQLEHYFIGFLRSDLLELAEVARLHLPDDNLYDELEIALPGHQRRLERAVRQLSKRQKCGENAELPITEGWWGKPRNLDDAKYDFLCVEATVTSTKDASRSHTIDFMVDSGSDVTTIQEDLLYTLNPELIGPINSKGVHGSCKKNLYRAKLTVGTHDLEIEIMGESYNSLGSRVLRHFRHYITGSKHIWLPGDYFDPVMSRSVLTPATVGAPVTVTSQEMCIQSEQTTMTSGETDDSDVQAVTSDVSMTSQQASTSGSSSSQSCNTQSGPHDCVNTKPDISTNVHENICSDMMDKNIHTETSEQSQVLTVTENGNSSSDGHTRT